MKTVEGALRALNDHFEYTGSEEPFPIGRLHADAAVRYLLGIPSELPAEAPVDRPPGILLEGREGMWLDLTRTESGRSFLLSMKDGETDRSTAEMQAVNRVRLFVEHWGEETDLTHEIRLSPEARRKILGRENALDAERRKRMAEGPQQVVFGKRVYQLASVLVFLGTAALAGVLVLALGTKGVPVAAAAAIVALGSLAALCLLFKTYRVEVDRRAGLIRVATLNGQHEIGRLEEIRQADVTRLEGNSALCQVTLLLAGEGKRTVGHRLWNAKDAAEIADAVNDAIDLPESERKFLAYRRRLGGQAS
jgi:hypothetical protein